MVIDAFSRKTTSARIQDLCLRITFVTLVLELIKNAQTEVVKEENRKSEMIVGHISTFDIDSYGLLTLQGRVWVLYSGGARHTLMDDAHKSKFSIHSGMKKMYRDLRHGYWWYYMKMDIAWYTERCLTCLRVKTKH